MKHSVEQSRLASGASLTLVRIPHAASSYFSLSFQSGYRYCTPENYHLPHVLEHAIFDGSKRYGTSQRVIEALGVNGTAFNASTSDSANTFEFHALKENLATIIPAAVEIVFHPLLSVDSIRQEMDVIRQETLEAAGNYEQQTVLASLAAVTPSLVLPPDEQLLALDTYELTAEDARAYHARHYGAKNCSIVLAGDFSRAEADELTRLIEDALSGVRKGKAYTPPDVMLGNYNQTVLPIETMQSQGVIAALRFTMPGRNDGLVTRLMILEGLTSLPHPGSIHSRARKAGLTYGVSSESTATYAYTTFTAWANTDHEHVEELVALIARSLREYATVSFSHADFEQVKANLIGSLKLSLTGASEIGAWYEQFVVTDRPLQDPNVLIKEISNLRPEDMLELTALINDENFVLSFAGHKASKLAQLLWAAVRQGLDPEALHDESAMRPLPDTKLTPVQQAIIRWIMTGFAALLTLSYIQFLLAGPVADTLRAVPAWHLPYFWACFGLGLVATIGVALQYRWADTLLVALFSSNVVAQWAEDGYRLEPRLEGWDTLAIAAAAAVGGGLWLRYKWRRQTVPASFKGRLQDLFGTFTQPPRENYGRRPVIISIIALIGLVPFALPLYAPLSGPAHLMTWVGFSHQYPALWLIPAGYVLALGLLLMNFTRFRKLAALVLFLSFAAFIDAVFALTNGGIDIPNQYTPGLIAAFVAPACAIVGCLMNPATSGQIGSESDNQIPTQSE